MARAVINMGENRAILVAGVKASLTGLCEASIA